MADSLSRDVEKVQTKHSKNERDESEEPEEAETTPSRKSCGCIHNPFLTRRHISFQLSAAQKGSCKDILVQDKENK